MKSLVVAGAIAASALAGTSQRATMRARASTVSAARAEPAVPFAVGETLTYDVSWSSYLTAGTVTATVKDKRPSGGATVYEIVAEGRTTPLLQRLYTLSYKFATLLDSVSLLPQRATTETQEGARHRVRTTTFDRGAGTAHYEIRTTTVVNEDVRIAPLTQDALSALYTLRAAPLKTGKRITIPVTDDGTNYKVSFDVGAPERVRVPAADANAWPVAVQIVDANGAAVGRHVVLWIADNAQRWPLKMQAELAVGTFTLALRQTR